MPIIQAKARVIGMPVDIAGLSTHLVAHMTDPFNKATITFDFEHREDAKVSLLIGTPNCVDDGEWRCQYQFVGFSNSRT
jgi:hypothetical protein